MKNHTTVVIKEASPIGEITWNQVNLTIPVGRGKNKIEKKVLVDVTGQVKAGQVVAIMGGSGAGKSTLLNTLAGRIGPGTLEGDILVDGQPRNPAMWKIQCAYVEQDDIMFSNLTVFETIRYSAFLRLPGSMSKKEKLDRVERVIASLGLNGCRNTPIGDANVRGVSGGERKRVAIGVELVTNPQILFLDEPTSGLDAFNALNIITTIKELAVKENKIVLMTIHQPRTDIINLFDNIVLLAQGQCFWAGSNNDALKHFDALGYPIPENTNPSDFYLDIGTVDQRTPELKEASQKRITSFVEAYNKIKPQGRKGFEADTSFAKSIWPASWFQEFSVLLDRNFVDLKRDKATVIGTLAQSVFITILMGFIFWRLGLDVAGVQSRTGVLFFLVVNLSFSVVMPIVNVFPLQREIFKRERAAGSYRASSAYLAKVVSSLPMPVIGGLILAIPIYWMVGLQNDVGKYFTFIAILTVQSLASATLGLAIGASVPNVTLGQILGPLIVVLFLIFGGLFVNLDKVPAALRWIQWISFISYSNKALNQNEFDANLIFDCPRDGACYRDGSQVISALALGSPTLWHCVLLNAALIVGFIIIGFIGFTKSSAPLFRLK
ncbi:P-loop containing nucleoside triphosphate hydrolase protein [Gorgonomyces haynaldii]|nr:P-loop containing nucleoside triphosphate hydrolase protein [Gorgonomyces haynaldii]